jgi:hypothetical protein
MGWDMMGWDAPGISPITQLGLTILYTNFVQEQPLDPVVLCALQRVYLPYSAVRAYCNFFT